MEKINKVKSYFPGEVNKFGKPLVRLFNKKKNEA